MRCRCHSLRKFITVITIQVAITIVIGSSLFGGLWRETKNRRVLAFSFAPNSLRSSQGQRKRTLRRHPYLFGQTLLRRTMVASATTSVNNETEIAVNDAPVVFTVGDRSRAEKQPTLLQERLFKLHGIPLSETFMTKDDDNAYGNAAEEKKEEAGYTTDGSAGFDKSVVVEIKTLVWEVVATKTSKNYAAAAADSADFVTKASTTFYVVAALQVKDKANLPKLKSLVLENLIAKKEDTKHQNKWSIQSMQLAPLKVAEAKTGYKSGCMPPICHTIDNLELYLDQSIVEPYFQNDARDSLLQNRPSTQSFASIGSGIPGKSLILPLRRFLQVAGVANLDGALPSRKTNSAKWSKRPIVCTVGHFIAGGTPFVSTTPMPHANRPSLESSVTNTDVDATSHGISDSNNSNELKMMSGPEIKRLRQDERKQQREARKDRLGEYRSFKKDDILSKAKLLRTTARKKGRIEEMEILLQEALACGDFAKLMEVPNEQSPETNIDKNALHICAWRGDFETVVRLVDLSNAVCPELDVVNLVSKGPGNYGKTPIFFALTQCREDVVKYLVQEAGADLLIVNNKGQTPCSIAHSHMTAETCQLLYETEAKQLKARSELTQKKGVDLFANYRASEHSDGKLYGDLDPRFPIDDSNRYFFGDEDVVSNEASNTKTDYDPKIFVGKDYMDRQDDLSDQIKAYEESVREASEDTVIQGIPTVFSPRSLRPTVRWWNREDGSLSAANNDSTGDQLTFTQSRKASAKPKSDTNNGKEVNRKGKEELSSSKPDPNNGSRFSSVDIKSLDQITIGCCFDSMSSISNGETRTFNDENLLLVDSLESLRQFEAYVDQYILQLTEDMQDTNSNTEDNTSPSDAEEQLLLKYAWGLDCEWKPGPECGVDSPVSTLQLATRTNAFLVDLQTLCRSNVDCNEENDSMEIGVDLILSKLFHNSNMSLVGFGVLQDLGKLAASFPHIKCFSKYASVIDLQSLSSIVYNNKRDRRILSSLQKMTAALLDKRLDKTQQVSDWSSRPLSKDQISYAMLDAAILPLLFKTIFDGNEVIERYNGRFFNVHSNLLSTVRYTPVEACPEGYAYEVAYGNVKSTLGTAFARQTWPTKMKLEAPELPKLIACIELSGDDNSTPRLSKKERAHLRKIGGVERKRRPKPIPLKELPGNLDNLPIPGISLGYTKESCALRVVGHELLQTVPEGTYIGFNRRAGVAETSNAWILFCNFGGDKVFSTFSENGRRLSFRVSSTAQSGRASEAFLYKEMVSKGTVVDTLPKDNEEKRRILLFARESTRSKYMYCGFCRCTDVVALDADTASLMLELENYEELIDPNSRISSGFESLVRGT